MKKAIVACLIAISTAQPALGQTVQNFEYDGFGRLVRTQRGSDTSTLVQYSYDLVDNRTRAKQGRSAPIATDDYAFAIYETTSGIFYGNYIFVLDNDNDSDFPDDSLSVTGLSGSGSGYFSIVSNYVVLSASVPDGSYAITYQIQDLDSLTASAVIYVDKITVTCGEFEC